MTVTARPLVCGIDFSPESRRALAAAASLAERLGCALHIVSAIEPLLAEAARHRRQLDAFTAQIERDLREFTAPLGLPEDRVTFKAIAGEPTAALLSAGASTEARMIVVGTRGRGGAARLVLGSTTLRLLRATDRPVLVTDWTDRPASADPALAPTISRIVCGVDFSDASLAAVKTATTLATDIGATVTLVHAISRDAVPVGWDSLVADVETERIADAKTRMADVARALGGSPAIEAKLGRPADVLAEATRTDPHAVIAVGIHGASSNRPGSTAIRVVSAASVPVLAVPE